MSERIPDLMVERLALGELPEAQAQTLRARLEADGDERLAAIGRTNAEILREHPPQRVAAEIQRRLDRLEDDQRPARAGWLVWAPVAAAAGLALVWWGTRDPESGTSPEVIARVEPPPSAGSGDPSVVTPPVADDGPEAIYLKGDPQLIVDRIVEMRPVAMSDRDPVSAGDRLQVSYRAAGMAQGVIVSIDGAGVATLHFPADEGASPRLDQGGRIPLMESYELDDAPGFERFFFVTLPDDEPSLEVAQVMDAARTLASEGGREGDLRLPEGWRQQSLLLLKPQTAQGEPPRPE
ncbi:MAG: hypothetical protein KC501_33630 [Myxococcales bacterium]|nr:hypothetical protein [Myxococcales bacterium]